MLDKDTSTCYDVFVNTIYIHFTSLIDALAIVKSSELWESSFVSGVYAAAEGGELVPGVQCTKLGRAKDRSTAVLFTTDIAPDVVYPEESIWHLPALPIKNAFIVPASEAQSLLVKSTLDIALSLVN